MDYTAQPSTLDSELFGYRVGLLSLDSKDADVQCIRTRNRIEYDVVFVKARGWVDQCDAAGGTDYLYEMEACILNTSLLPKDVMFLGAPMESHLEIARTGFQDSRFTRDPMLAVRGKEMYAQWIRKAGVYVLQADPSAGFLLVTRDADGVRRIRLVAIDESKRGRGLGSTLMFETLRLGPLHDLKTWRVKVMAKNPLGIRCYENLGFRVVRVETAFHVWT